MRRNLFLLLALTGLMPATATAAAVISPQAQSGGGNTVRTRCTDCASSRVKDRAADRARREKLLMTLDSLRWEFEHERLTDAERERLRKEMSLAVRALEESLDEVSVRVVYPAEAERAAEAARAWSSTSSSSMAMAVRSRSGSRGYLGVTFDGPSMDYQRDNERVIRFYQYPMIALVEPSSPAERAGIRQGDTLLALNGTDVVAREISLTRMLVPREQLLVKVRRDGSPRDLRVTVGEAPEYVIRRTPPAVIAPMVPMEPMGSVSVRVPSPARAPAPPSMMTPPAAGAVWVFNDGIGGARVETITEGLGKALGVKAGVLVVRAGNGTLAYESGLRDGDVILRAAGKDVGSVRELRSALADSDDEAGVKLVLLRERKQREVTLRW